MLLKSAKVWQRNTTICDTGTYRYCRLSSRASVVDDGLSLPQQIGAIAWRGQASDAVMRQAISAGALLFVANIF
jgi:hypothetical protein